MILCFIHRCFLILLATGSGVCTLTLPYSTRLRPSQGPVQARKTDNFQYSNRITKNPTQQKHSTFPQSNNDFDSYISRTLLEMTSDPDPTMLISTKDDVTQRIAFVSAFAALFVGTNICINVWHGPILSLVGNDYYQNIRTTLLPISFGIIFSLVGIAHFVFDTNFIRIVPPKGTWGGLWQVPAPGMDILGISYEAYHCYWTGIAEFVGGMMLFLSALGKVPVSTEFPSALLFLLTIGVTPANLYMFTHNATPGGAIPKLDYPYGHIARFIVQCGLLSNFWIMANP